MDTHCADELSPDDPRNNEARRQEIVRVWNELRACDETGATTWDVLGPLELEVTECLDRKPPDLLGAWSRTALAALLMDGCDT